MFHMETLCIVICWQFSLGFVNFYAHAFANDINLLFSFFMDNSKLRGKNINNRLESPLLCFFCFVPYLASISVFSIKLNNILSSLFFQTKVYCVILLGSVNKKQIMQSRFGGIKDPEQFRSV